MGLRIIPLIAASAGLLLAGCGASSDPENQALEKSLGSKLHPGPAEPHANGVRADDLKQP